MANTYLTKHLGSLAVRLQRSEQSVALWLLEHSSKRPHLVGMPSKAQPGSSFFFPLAGRFLAAMVTTVCHATFWRSSNDPPNVVSVILAINRRLGRSKMARLKYKKKRKCYIQLVLALLLLGLPEGWLMFALPTSVTGQLWHLRLHCGPKLKRPGFQVRWGQIQRVHVSVCVCSTRSKLPTLSPWHNRLNVMCMKWHFLSQKSSVFYWAVA